MFAYYKFMLVTYHIGNYVLNMHLGGFICVNYVIYVRNHLQISLLILSKLITFYSPRNHDKTIGFLMVSGGVEGN